ncbi:MAG: hypothetical protein NTW94_05180 [Legionellales bacterium]|nr:hypothetical protein [Legionellales bacterium]
MDVSKTIDLISSTLAGVGGKYPEYFEKMLPSLRKAKNVTALNIYLTQLLHSEEISREAHTALSAIQEAIKSEIEVEQSTRDQFGNLRTHAEFESSLAMALLKGADTRVLQSINQKMISYLNKHKEAVSEKNYAILSSLEQYKIPFSRGLAPIDALIELLSRPLDGEDRSHIICECASLHLIFFNYRGVYQPERDVESEPDKQRIADEKAVLHRKLRPKKPGEMFDEETRGRQRVSSVYRTSDFGICEPSSTLSEWRNFHRYEYTPHKFRTSPNPDSPIVKTLQAHGVPFIAGPSGTAGDCLEGLQFLAPDLIGEERQSYLNLLAAAEVGLGHHSMHEIMLTACNMDALPMLYRDDIEKDRPVWERINYATSYQSFLTSEFQNTPEGIRLKEEYPQFFSTSKQEAQKLVKEMKPLMGPEAAVIKLQRQFRAKASSSKFHKAVYWKEHEETIPPEEVIDKKRFFTKEKSQQNLRKLKKELGVTVVTDERAIESEKRFLRFFMSCKFDLAHYTAQLDKILENGVLLSYDRLLEKFKVGFKQNSSSDIATLGNTNYVFFRMELIHNFKMLSRFGGDQLVIEGRTSDLLDHGIVSLYEMLYPSAATTCIKLSYKGKLVRKYKDPYLAGKFQYLYGSKLETFDVASTVFYGKDIMEGIALAFLREVRRIGGEFQADFIELFQHAIGDQERGEFYIDPDSKKYQETLSTVNKILSDLFRLEAKIPSVVYIKNEKVKIWKESDLKEAIDAKNYLKIMELLSILGYDAAVIKTNGRFEDTLTHALNTSNYDVVNFILEQKLPLNDEHIQKIKENLGSLIPSLSTEGLQHLCHNPDHLRLFTKDFLRQSPENLSRILISLSETQQKNVFAALKEQMSGSTFTPEQCRAITSALPENIAEPFRTLVYDKMLIPFQAQQVTQTRLYPLNTADLDKLCMHLKDQTSYLGVQMLHLLLDSNIETVLLDKLENFTAYREESDLCVQFSHDDQTSSEQNPAMQFLKTHFELIKGQHKNQDVIMVGHSMVLKHQALMLMKDKLIADGFTRIEFYNSDLKSNEILHEDTSITPQKTYRVIYTEHMTRLSMMACTALSGPLMGATGEQSFSEAIRADKMIIYESVSPNSSYVAAYDRAVNTLENPELSEAITLLRGAASDEEYERLGILLRQPAVKIAFSAANKQAEKQDNIASMLAEHQLIDHKQMVQYLFLLIQTGKQEEAWNLFLPLSKDINIFEMVQGERIYDIIVEELATPGNFLTYCQTATKKLLLDAITSKAQEAAIEMVEKLGLGYLDTIDGKNLISLAQSSGQDKLIFHLLTPVIITRLNSNDPFGAQRLLTTWLDHRQTNRIIYTFTEGKSLLQRAIEKEPDGPFSQLYRSSPFAMLFLDIENKNEKEAIKKFMNLDFSSPPNSEFKDFSVIELAEASGLANLYKIACQVRIVMFLNMGLHKVALKQLERLNGSVSVFDRVKGKTILQYALENNGKGDLVKHMASDPEVKLCCMMFAKDSVAAEQLISEKGLTFDSIMQGKTIREWAIEFNDSKLVHHFDLQKMKRYLQFPRQEAALEAFKQFESIGDFSDQIDGKPILQYAFEKNPNGALVRYAQSNPNATLFIAVMSKNIKEISRLMKERELSLESILFGKPLKEQLRTFECVSLLSEHMPEESPHSLSPALSAANEGPSPTRMMDETSGADPTTRFIGQLVSKPPISEYMTPFEFQYILNHITQYIGTARDFQSIMKDLSKKQQNSLYNAIKDKLPSMMTSVDDYVAILSSLSTNTVDDICSEIQLDLTRSINLFKDIMKSLPMGHKTVIFKSLADVLPQRIETAQDYIDIVGVLSGKSAVAFRRACQEKITTLIKSAEDFVLIMTSLNGSERNALYLKMKDSLPSMIKSGWDFIHIQSILPDDVANTFHKTLYDKFPNIILSSTEFREVLIANINQEYRDEIYLIMKDHLPSIIKTADDLFTALLYLTPRQSEEMILKIKDSLPSLALPESNTHQFQVIVKCLHEETQDIILTTIKSDLIEWVQHVMPLTTESDASQKANFEDAMSQIKEANESTIWPLYQKLHQPVLVKLTPEKSSKIMTLQTDDTLATHLGFSDAGLILHKTIQEALEKSFDSHPTSPTEELSSIKAKKKLGRLIEHIKKDIPDKPALDDHSPSKK